MANQPKKYKKFVATAATATLVASAIVPVASAAGFTDVVGNDHEVAINALADAGIINGYADGTFKPNQTINRGQVVKLLGRWLEGQGQEIPADWNTKQRFNDLPVTAEEELVKYAALAKDAGVFAGSNGNLNAAQTMQRQQMAVVLVRAIKEIAGVDLVAEYRKAGFVTEIADLEQAYSTEQRSAIVALEYAGITKVTRFNPGNSVTRGQFASFLYRTIENVVNAPEAGAATVKAVNNTTVEVTFDKEVDNIQALNFSITDLEVKNAAVKQTNKKVVVLTTAAQTADKEYTVSLGEEKIGTFKGIAAVIPTKVDLSTASLQGVIGNEVTLRAQVTVPEGQDKSGIPVTFNIVNDKVANEKIERVAYTNADGVATYTYTRYYASADTVAAYSINRATVVSTAKVYWDTKIQLAVSEITAGNKLANNAKKSYKVTGEKNTTYYIAIKENIKVTPDKVAKVFVQNYNSNNFVTPYELTTGSNVYATVRTNNNGEANFTIYGSRLSATPIVYLPSSVNAVTTPPNNSYSRLALQAEAPTVEFGQVDKLAISVVAEGVAESAQSAFGTATIGKAYDAGSIGGREYTVTVTDKDGKIAPEGTLAYVTFERDNISGDVYFSTAKEAFTKVTQGNVKAIRVDKDGKVKFRVAGHGATTFVKPTVFLNTEGSTSSPVLDKEDIQTVADATYFKEAIINNAKLKVTDANNSDREIKTAAINTDVFVTYQTVDQNGFAYRPATNTSTNRQIVFDVSSSFGNITVKDQNGTLLNETQNLGNVKTYPITMDENGKAVIRLTTNNPDTVTINVTGSGVLPTQAATVSFTRYSSAAVASGKVIAKDSDRRTFVIQNGNRSYSYSYATADVAQYQITGSQVDYATFNAALTIGDEVTATLTSDGKYILNIRVNEEKDLPVTINSQGAFNQALSNGATSFNLNIGSEGLTIDTQLAKTINLSGTINGDLTINAPNLHVNSSTTITGNVIIKDVAGSSFVNTGTIGGNVTITDSNATFRNTGTFNGQIIFDGTGKQSVTLEGTSNNSVIVGKNVTELALTSGSVYKSLGVNNSSTKVTEGGQDVQNKVSVTGSKGIENATLTWDESNNRLTLMISDADLNKSPSVAETFTVDGKYGNSNLQLTFTETGINTGKFQAIVNLTGNEDVTFTYVDTTTTDELQKTVKFSLEQARAKKELDDFISRYTFELDDKNAGIQVGDEIHGLYHGVDDNAVYDAPIFVVPNDAKNTDVPENVLFILLKDAEELYKTLEGAKKVLDDANATTTELKGTLEKLKSSVSDIAFNKVDQGVLSEDEIIKLQEKSK